MRFRSSRILLISSLFVALAARGQSSKVNAVKNGGDFSNNTSTGTKVPPGILVKGAWSSASDSVTAVPEDAKVANNVFSDLYFGISYTLPADWEEKYKGPPPSDSGRYVLAQLRPADTFRGPARGNILITAQDMFFTPLPVLNALELIKDSAKDMEADYKVEMPPTLTKIAGRPFAFFAYWSPVAELHWYVAATEIRCHAIEIVLTSRDTKLLATLVTDMDKMTLPAEAAPTEGRGGGDVPVCVENYASDENMISRVEPIFTEHKFNSVPVRIVIDREGKVKHIHFLNAFPDQAKVISDALGQWRFKPYKREGRAVEVETGIVFGRAMRRSATGNSATQ